MIKSRTEAPQFPLSALALSVTVIGYIKGKSAIARRFVGKEKNFTGQNFWARGYYVSTVGRDETAIRKYIQEQEDKRLDQLDLFKE
jgi:putative transposase